MGARDFTHKTLTTNCFLACDFQTRNNKRLKTKYFTIGYL